MALPPRLWLPDGTHELPTSPLGQVGAMLRPATSDTTPVQRLRRRALWRGESGLPDRPVLVEWFASSELERERQAARHVQRLCHVHLLRLLDLGAADGRSAYAVSEAPDGVDLFTAVRAAPGELPPWWGIAVAAAVTRALCAIEEHQRRSERRASGHGRVGLSTVFVGWDGSVRLLAFSPLGNSAAQKEEGVAPELRLSDRLLTPAADVYALGVLLRQLLPAAALARPSVARLLRRCLHTQADQRLALRTLQQVLGELYIEMQGPAARTLAIGEVLGQCCPRATADLVDADWGESTDEGYPALPPTLAPLAASTVALSPAWLRSTPPPRRSRWSSLSIFAAPLCIGIALTALFWLWPATPRPAATEVTAAPLAAPALAPLGMANADDDRGLPLRPGAASCSFFGLRLSIDGVEKSGDHLAVVVRLVNLGEKSQSPDLSQLRLRTDSTSDSAQSPLKAEPITVGAGRMQRVRLLFLSPGRGTLWLR